MLLQEKHLQVFETSGGVYEIIDHVGIKLVERGQRELFVSEKGAHSEGLGLFAVHSSLQEGLGGCVQDLPCISPVPVSFLLLQKELEK